MSASAIGGRRRHTVRVLAVALLALVVSACDTTWGIRTSYRSYVAGFIGQGEIIPVDGAGWQDGPGAGKGPFTWTVDSASIDEAAGTGWVQLRGGVITRAHQNDDGVWLLDTTFRNPRLEIDGDTGTLYVDLNFRPFEGTDPEPIPNRQAVLNAPFATVDLSGQDLTANDQGWYSIEDAPMVGIDETMELISWDDFYGSEPELDPLSTMFKANGPGLLPWAGLTVSDTEDLQPGDQITVWGYGFDPTAHTGTRPPLGGEPSGAYVIFGRFADVWRPSESAPSSARRVIDQRWALPASSRALVDPTGTNASYVTIDDAGRFEAILTVGTDDTVTGNYGVYTYAGSGAVNADQELAQLVTLG
ncbi:MAG: hypothetical protein GXY13_12795 [Acidimicrobiales bacterium]|nr:hypothetical protein [Acidimicrobiales bacterium]